MQKIVRSMRLKSLVCLWKHREGKASVERLSVDNREGKASVELCRRPDRLEEEATGERQTLRKPGRVREEQGGKGWMERDSGRGGG